MTKKCEWCHGEFETWNPEKVYCKLTHATKATAKRRKARHLLETAGKCPTPYKRSWSSPEQAVLFKIPANQYLYTCACGATHSATYKEHRKTKAAA